MPAPTKQPNQPARKGAKGSSPSDKAYFARRKAGLAQANKQRRRMRAAKRIAKDALKVWGMRCQHGAARHARREHLRLKWNTEHGISNETI